jgi:hypothetical protein
MTKIRKDQILIPGAVLRTGKVSSDEIKELIDSRKEQPKIEPPAPCPCCKSLNTSHIVKRDSNNVCGPGFHSWIVDQYHSCGNCGVRFDVKNVTL